MSKYLSGSTGWLKGAFGGNKSNNGSFGGTTKPYSLNKAMDPLFILNEYGLTNKGTNTQLQGMKSMLHSLQAPSYGPEIFTPTSNYGAVQQQYDDAEADLKNTPILGTDINQHIAQQQALGEQGVKINRQRMQTLGDMRNSDLAQLSKNEYQNALSRHETEEERRKFDMAIKQQIQDNEDVATAIKTNAVKQLGNEFYSLHKMKELRENAKNLAALKRDYVKNKQYAVDSEKANYDLTVAQEFKDQFTNDYNNMQDVDEFMNKYGITYDDYANGISAMYETDAYKTKFDEYKTSKEGDWITQKNQLLSDFDDNWWKNNEEKYWSYMKEGGKIQRNSKNTSRDEILERLSRKNEKIAVNNNKALHDFVKQMNEKQAKIFLKLMSL